MSRDVIRIEELSKQYLLGGFGWNTLGDDLRRLWKSGQYSESEREVWALRNLDLSIRESEILGIIGKNGAGKSTLLKLLSRVTDPTSGRIKVKGRISSLLEVGTGMHPELSGRENVFLNGAILGMSKTEIAGKFDEIVNFSDCGRFIDTPIKRYSSGMKVRLGFAVAAFLDADILVVDEVLAVGDAEFQKRAIGKMQEITRSSGRTVLFVSHNLRSIQTLCSRVILLEGGQLTSDGNAREVIASYLGEGGIAASTMEFSVQGIKVSGGLRCADSLIFEDQPFSIALEIEGDTSGLDLTLNFKNDELEPIVTSSSLLSEITEGGAGSGLKKFSCRIPGGFFISGRYHIDVSVISDRTKLLHRQENALTLEVVEGKKKLGAFQGRSRGYVLAPFEWKID